MARRSCAATARDTAQAPISFEAMPVTIVPQAKMPGTTSDANAMNTTWSMGAETRLEIMMRSDSGRLVKV
jgi:hypothetical protein